MLAEGIWHAWACLLEVGPAQVLRAAMMAFGGSLRAEAEGVKGRAEALADTQRHMRARPAASLRRWPPVPGGAASASTRRAAGPVSRRRGGGSARFFRGRLETSTAFKVDLAGRPPPNLLVDIYFLVAEPKAPNNMKVIPQGCPGESSYIGICAPKQSNSCGDSEHHNEQLAAGGVRDLPI